MQKTKPEEFLNRYKRPLAAFALASAVFLSFAHHAVNYWELPALGMLLLFLLFVPLFAWGIFLLVKKAAPHIAQIPGRRIFYLIIPALMIGLFITWRIYRVPADYQTITITPVLSGDQTIGLIELKAAGNILRIRQAALASKWQEANGVLYATQASRPITFSFRRPVNAPVSVLFMRSPQGGLVDILFENERVRTDLSGAEPGDVDVEFLTRYRGLPNWVFIPLLILIDLINFGALVLAALLLQEIGQRVEAGSPKPDDRFLSHRAALTVLLGLGFVLHMLNALAVPLILDSDSPAYLQGAAHWLRYGNLDGVPVFRGPGTTFLFAPILWAFGRDSWGMKVLLHLLGLACIPLSYRLGWQLSGRRLLAFLSGLVVILIPDIYLYSNFVMSDLPNLFLVLVFCTYFISTLQAPEFLTTLLTLLAASFASLLRSENVVLLLVAFLFLAIPQGYAWLRDITDRNAERKDTKKHLRTLSMTGLAFLIAVLPLLGWAVHHNQLHGFYSLGNHTGIVLYDGWVYYGDASKLSFSDPDSPAVREIEAALAQNPVDISDRTGVPTSMEVLPALRAAGYSEYQAFKLLEQAAWDSILKDRDLTLKLLFIKIEAGLQPEFIYTMTYSLPGEAVWTSGTKAEFFDAENMSLPLLIVPQRWINGQVSLWYPYVYPLWVLFCILALTLSLYRSPAGVWIVLVLIVATRIFVPQVMGLSSWRYTLAGWIPLQVIAVGWVDLIFRSIKKVFFT